MINCSIVDKSVSLVPNPNQVTTKKLNEIKKELFKKKIVNDQVKGESCQDAKLLYKAFQKLGLFVLSDKLQLNTGCDTLTDVTGQEKREEEPPYFESPVAFTAAVDYDDVNIRLSSVAVPVAEAALAPAGGSPLKKTNVQKLNSSGKPEKVEAPTVELRNYFPETWLFDLISLDVDGKNSIDLNAPDTVTTWIGDAFCTSEETGVVVADRASFVVDQDFFVDLKMPFSIKRGEIFPINVTAFNKLNTKSLPLKLTVLESDDLKLGGEEREICLEAQDSQTQSFAIKAKELQEVNVTVQAKIESFKGCQIDGDSEGITDKVQKPIQVKPEGFPIEEVTSEFLCRKTADDEDSIIEFGQVELPDESNLVPGSARGFISVTGELMSKMFISIWVESM